MAILFDWDKTQPAAFSILVIHQIKDISVKLWVPQVHVTDI
uniref:Uncharacterized protein n=1 Tax=Arundo donax TaxID=35708 RepID=A0A0A9FI28_ARUDO